MQKGDSKTASLSRQEAYSSTSRLNQEGKRRNRKHHMQKEKQKTPHALHNVEPINKVNNEKKKAYIHKRLKTRPQITNNDFFVL